ncbi:MAG: hypothetical protein ACTHKZ_04305 [Lysobacteraceae bacterium]
MNRSTLRALLLPGMAAALLAGCVTGYEYRSGPGDYYYGQPEVEYRDDGWYGWYGYSGYPYAYPYYYGYPYPYFYGGGYPYWGPYWARPPHRHDHDHDPGDQRPPRTDPPPWRKDGDGRDGRPARPWMPNLRPPVPLPPRQTGAGAVTPPGQTGARPPLVPPPRRTDSRHDDAPQPPAPRPHPPERDAHRKSMR